MNSPYLAVLAIAVSAFHCGGSTEITAENGAPSPGADGAAGGAGGTGGSTGITDGGGLSGLLGLLDALPIPDSGPVGACVTCVKDQCTAPLSACLSDAKCQNGLTCVATTCGASLAGGVNGATAADALCLLGCFGGDTAAIMKAMGALTCITGTCTSTCSSLVGGGDAGRGRDATTEAMPADVVQPDDAADAVETDATPD
jgi:hypothetical protein